MIHLLLALAAINQPIAWKDEVLCRRDSGHCGPRVVNLGSWDPTPAAKDWPKNAYIKEPSNWTADETGPAPTP